MLLKNNGDRTDPEQYILEERNLVSAVCALLGAKQEEISLVSNFNNRPVATYRRMVFVAPKERDYKLMMLVSCNTCKKKLYRNVSTGKRFKSVVSKFKANSIICNKCNESNESSQY